MAVKRMSFLSALKAAGAKIHRGKELVDETGDHFIGEVEIEIESPDEAERIVAAAVDLMFDDESEKVAFMQGLDDSLKNSLH